MKNLITAPTALAYAILGALIVISIWYFADVVQESTFSTGLGPVLLYPFVAGFGTWFFEFVRLLVVTAGHEKVGDFMKGQKAKVTFIKVLCGYIGALIVLAIILITK